MSVYTSISEQEFAEILNTYSLGGFVSAQGIQAGIENTNYFVTTTKGQYVFTLFEKINRQLLTLYISLLEELSQTGFHCPQPQPDIHQQNINEIKNKPFIFVTRLNGKNVHTVNLTQCKAIALELAKLHSTPLAVSNTFQQQVKNRRGKFWREQTAKKLIHKLSANDARLLSSEIEFYQSFDDSDLPKGIVHADLFKDNALFEKNELCGIIDFYDACYEHYLYDIAITVNAWCNNEKGELIDSLVDAFFNSYQALRPLTPAEQKAWPVMLRIAAFRFWLSRLEDNVSQRQGDLTHTKDPLEYRRILQNHIKSAHGSPRTLAFA